VVIEFWTLIEVRENLIDRMSWGGGLFSLICWPTWTVLHVVILGSNLMVAGVVRD
jgi:hypothetical protein